MTRLNYTSRDYSALLAELRQEAQAIFPDWTDWNDANAGNAILGAMALLGDILNANQDAQFNEVFWDSARHRRSIISQAKLVGYHLASAKPAVATVQATVPATAGGITIPKGTRIYTAGINPVRTFELQGDLTIPAGQTTGTATAKHIETREDAFTANGTADQRFTLTWAPYLDGTAVVVVDGQAWAEVDNFVGSTAADLHYTIEVDEADKATVTFGDGTVGARPSGNVVVTYGTGGGLAGNVPANSLRILDGAFSNSLGAGVQVTVTNPAAATGGAERESIETARKMAPNRLKATTRTVSREDYETNALITGVVRAKAASQAELETLALNQTGLYIVPAEGGAPSQELRDQVRQTLITERPIQLGWDVIVLAPTYRTIDVNVTITAQPGADRDALKADAEASIRRWFDPQRTTAAKDDPWQDKTTWTGSGDYSIAWGMTVYAGQLLALLFRDPQARVFNVAVTAPQDTTCGPLEFPVLGTLNVVVV